MRRKWRISGFWTGLRYRQSLNASSDVDTVKGKGRLMHMTSIDEVDGCVVYEWADGGDRGGRAQDEGYTERGHVLSSSASASRCAFSKSNALETFVALSPPGFLAPVAGLVLARDASSFEMRVEEEEVVVVDADAEDVVRRMEEWTRRKWCLSLASLQLETQLRGRAWARRVSAL